MSKNKVENSQQTALAINTFDSSKQSFFDFRKTAQDPSFDQTKLNVRLTPNNEQLTILNENKQSEIIHF